MAPVTKSKVPVYCNQCVCGPDLMKVEVEDGVALRVQPNFDVGDEHPGCGRVCVKAYGLIQKTYNPNRIKQPMKRTNPKKGKNEDPGFVPISWDEALDMVAGKLNDIRAKGVKDEVGLPRLAISFGGGGTPARYMQQLISHQRVDGIETTVTFLATLAVLKIATTSFTISSGGSGGVFAPSLFIGAMLGGCVGILSQQMFPDLVLDVTPFVVVGMGAFFAGVANAPIASLMMVCELTGAYELLPPLMVVAIIALVTSRRWSIYTTQVDDKFSTRAHLWEMNPSFLKRVTIDDAMRGVYDRSAIISANLPLAKIEALARESGECDLLLRNDRGELAGLLSLNELGEREDLEHLGSLVLADDLINRRTVSLGPDDSLIRALEFFGEGEFDKLPIVTAAEDGSRLLGHVGYRDIIGFYQREHNSSEAQPTAVAGDPPSTPQA